MASKITVNKARFKDRKESFISKMSWAAEDASRIGLQMIIDFAIARAPSPFEEERLVNGGDIKLGRNVKFVKFNDPKEMFRVRFFKSSSQMFIKDAIASPLNYVMTKTGFKVGNVRLLDEMTGWSWYNVQQKDKAMTQVEMTSKHGTFWSFEYGFQWLVTPRVAQNLAPEPGIYTGPFVKSIPAFGMFTGQNPQEIMDAIKARLAEVEF